MLNKREKMKKHLNILTKPQLENICFTLKKYLAEISKYKDENNLIIANLNLKEERPDISNISNPNLIIFKYDNKNADHNLNYGTLISKEDISEKDFEIKGFIEKLKKEKAILNEKYDDSISEMTKLSQMVKNEQENNKFYIKQTIEVPSKIKFIVESSKQIDENILTKEQKSTQLIDNKTILTNEINKMQDIFYTQTFNLTKLANDIISIENEIQMTNKRLEEKNKKLEKANNLAKISINQNIENQKAIQTEKEEKVNSYVKLVLGLELIKKYFITGTNLNEKIDLIKCLYESPDYLNFKSFSINYSEKDEKSIRGEKMANVLSVSSLNSQSTKTSFQLQYKISDLQENLNKLDLKYEDLENLSTFLIYKRKFYHNYIINFNSICFQLETKKERFFKRFNDILEKNYKNFIEFQRNNSRLDNFLKNKMDFNKENIKKTSYNIDLHDNFIDYKNKFIQLLDKIKYFLNYYLTLPKNCLIDSIEIQNEFSSIEKKYEDLEINNDVNLNKSEITKMINNTSNYYLKLVFSKENLETFRNDNRKKSISIEQIEELILYFQSNVDLFFSVEKLKFELVHFINISKLNKYVDLISSIIKVLDLLKNFQEKLSLTKENLSLSIKKPNNAKNKKSSITTNFFLSKDKSNKNAEYTQENDEEKEEIEIISEKNEYKSRNLESRETLKLSDKKFQQTVHENMRKISIDTKFHKKEIYILKKKKSEISKISNEIIINNNPKINIDDLSQNTYNIFVKGIIEKQMNYKILKDSYKCKKSTETYKLERYCTLQNTRKSKSLLFSSIKELPKISNKVTV